MSRRAVGTLARKSAHASGPIRWMTSRSEEPAMWPPPASGAAAARGWSSACSPGILAGKRLGPVPEFKSPAPSRNRRQSSARSARSSCDTLQHQAHLAERRHRPPRKTTASPPRRPASTPATRTVILAYDARAGRRHCLEPPRQHLQTQRPGQACRTAIATADGVFQMPLKECLTDIQSGFSYETDQPIDHQGSQRHDWREAQRTRCTRSEAELNTVASCVRHSRVF